MESKKTEDVDEIQVFNEIRKETGILPVRFRYMPKGMVLIEYEIDKKQNGAVLFYDYNGQIIRYSMYMNDTDSSHGQIELDQLINEYQITVEEDIVVNIKEYMVDNYNEVRYIAQFEYADAQYNLIGLMKKQEFIGIIKNLFFYDQQT